MTAASGAAVVAGPEDRLGNAVEGSLEDAGHAVVRVAPDRLSDLPATIGASAFRLDGLPVRSILFRAPPTALFSGSFVEDDRSFCDSETRAVWLAAMHLDDMLAVNRLEPWAWFGSAGWADWRRGLAEAGVPLAPFAFGEAADDSHRFWYTYGGTRPRAAPGDSTRRVLGAALTPHEVAFETVVAFGEVVAGDAPPGAEETVEALGEIGLEIASVAFDREGRVLSVDPLPPFRDADVVERTSARLTERIDAHLPRR